MKRFKQITAAFACIAALFVTGCGSTADSRSTGQVIDDTAIHTKVKAALVNDPVVAGTAINVDVNRGAVVLTGAVNGDVEKTKAEDLARGVNGVRSVENNLVVRETQPSTTR
ncbi:MAG TPA: BON domain-containing protein [Verrucomicrobiae bacterium]